MTDEKRVLSDDERRELARRDRAALLVYQTLREDDKATIDRVVSDRAEGFTRTDHGPRPTEDQGAPWGRCYGRGATWDCHLARKKERVFRDHMERLYGPAISDAANNLIQAEGDAWAAGLEHGTLLTRLAEKLAAKKDAKAVRPLRGAPARAGDAWEEGRE